MNRLLRAVVVFVCLLGFGLGAQGQTTTITASALKMAGAPISVGTVTFTPVNLQGIPISFADGTGAQNGPTAFSCAVTTGALVGAIAPDGTTSGTCTVPDATETSPANILYQIQVCNTSTGLSTSGKCYTLQAVVGVSGTTWALDHYGSPTQTTTVAPLQASQGATTPTSCIAPSVFTNSTNGVFYKCLKGIFTVSSGPSAGSRVVYQKNSWADLSDFTVDSANVTAALSNGQITLSGNAQSLLGYLALNISQAADEYVDFEVTFTVTSAPGTSSSGISIGKESTNTRTDDNSSLGASLNLYTVGTPQIGWLQGQGAAFTQLGFAPSGTFSQGDKVRLVFSQRGDKFTLVYDDLTQGTHFSNSFRTEPDGTVAAPNMSKLAIWVQGGTYTISSIRAISRQAYSPNLALLGDSKTSCYGASTQSLCMSSQLDALGPVAVYAGQGDMTAQVLAGLPYVIASNPKQVILCIGYNDVYEGVALSTTEATYTSIVSQLKAAGITVIHMISPPSNAGVNMAPFNTWLQSTFSADHIIDPTVGWNSSLFLAADNVHPNDLGHAFLSNLILSSGYVSALPIPFVVSPLPSLSQYSQY